MLKRLRTERGYTLEYVGECLGYKSKSGYWMLENSKVKLTVDKIEKLAYLYGVKKGNFFKIKVQET